MYIEIEAKLKVDSLEETAKRLAEIDAEFLAEQSQRDIYFDDSGSAMVKGDRCLRIRCQKAGGREKFFLTYKGAKEKGQFKTRREIEIEISDGNAAEKLLSELGYKKRLVIEKKRRLWRVGRCEVALDELTGLGNFVEIEGPGSEEIAAVQAELQLADLTHIPESYACLWRKKYETG